MCALLDIVQNIAARSRGATIKAPASMESKGAGGELIAGAPDDDTFKVSISRNSQGVKERLLSTRADFLTATAATMMGAVLDRAIKAAVAEGVPRKCPHPHYIFVKEPRIHTDVVVVELKEVIAAMVLGCVIEVVGYWESTPKGDFYNLRETLQ